MTTYELIQKLAQYPADTKVTIAHDWSEPEIEDCYLQIEGDPTITLQATGWAASEATRVPHPNLSEA